MSTESTAGHHGMLHMSRPTDTTLRTILPPFKTRSGSCSSRHGALSAPTIRAVREASIDRRSRPDTGNRWVPVPGPATGDDRCPRTRALQYCFLDLLARAWPRPQPVRSGDGAGLSMSSRVVGCSPPSCQRRKGAQLRRAKKFQKPTPQRRGQ